MSTSTSAAIWGEIFWFLNRLNCKCLLKAGGVFEEINRKMPSVRKALVASLDTSPLPVSTCTQVVTWKCTVKTITNMRFWESIIENGCFGAGGVGWVPGQPLTKLKLCKPNTTDSQAMRWDPLSNVGSHVISCETTSRGMLSQIRDRRAPAFSTHARSWLLTLVFSKFGR